MPDTSVCLLSFLGLSVFTMDAAVTHPYLPTYEYENDTPQEQLRICREMIYKLGLAKSYTTPNGNTVSRESLPALRAWEKELMARIDGDSGLATNHAELT